MDEPGISPPQQMTPAQLVGLVDAAMRSRKPAAYLTGVRASFQAIGRPRDAEATHVLTVMFEGGEIEMVLSLRAEWNRAAQRRWMT